MVAPTPASNSSSRRNQPFNTTEHFVTKLFIGGDNLFISKMSTILVQIRTLKDIIVEQQRQLQGAADTVRRDILDQLEPLLDLPRVLIISGMRRAGKSTLLTQIREAFYPDDPVFYFNFEDERLLKFGVEDFNKLHEAFLELVGDSKVYFLDEIQNIANWEVFVRRMHDAGWKIIITGSNASMLSKELGTRLTGRHIRLELFPFSFAEYLRWKQIPIPPHLATEDRAAIKRAYREFFRTGGIPEQVIFDDPNLVTMLYENILYRDVLARYNLGDERALKELAFYLVSNPATEISYRRLAKMTSVGSVNTIKNYIEYMENAYLLFTVYKFDYSVRRQVQAPKKIYVSDPGFISHVAFTRPKFTGKILENLILIELKRRGQTVFYHKGKFECDFLVVENNEVRAAIQVSAEILPHSKEREFRGLLEALESYSLDDGLIITEDGEYEESAGDKVVRVVPAWKWLLELC